MGFAHEHVERLSRALDEPSWLTERRQEAWGYYEKLELPREKDEPWRYTDLRRLGFDLDDFSPVLPYPRGTPAQPNPYDAGLALGVDPRLEERGVVLLPLSNAIQTHPELVQRHLLSQGNPGQDIFTALHTAFFSGGTFLYVPRGVDVEIPIEATRTLSEEGVGIFPHTLVVVDEGSSVVFLDRYRSENLTQPSLSDAGVEIVVGPGSSVTFVAMQEYGRGVWHFGTQRASLGREASLQSLVVTLGGSFSRAQVETTIGGEHGDVQMLGLYFASGDQHFDMRTLQDHAAPRSTSDLLYKGALRDRSHTVYSGLIRVEPHAEKTDAYQANRNLVLSDHAKADSKPELEILNNDVRCTHGSTVGQVDDEQLFYLESRGISHDDAQRLIVEGFFEDVINRVRVEAVRNVLHDAIARKLAG
jgi:Fe-S cluster assembly protein SufD